MKGYCEEHDGIEQKPKKEADVSETGGKHLFQITWTINVTTPFDVKVQNILDADVSAHNARNPSAHFVCRHSALG